MTLLHVLLTDCRPYCFLICIVTWIITNDPLTTSSRLVFTYKSVYRQNLILRREQCRKHQQVAKQWCDDELINRWRHYTMSSLMSDDDEQRWWWRWRSIPIVVVQYRILKLNLVEQCGMLRKIKSIVSQNIHFKHRSYKYTLYFKCRYSCRCCIYVKIFILKLTMAAAVYSKHITLNSLII